MARDYIDIGSAPAEEDCAQVGSPDYHARARPECIRFIDLIRKVLGPEPEGATLQVKSNPHDFGSYLSVVCYFDDDNEAASDYAYRCESDGPTTWDAPTPDGDQTPAARVSRVCDSCLAAAEEEGIPDRESQAMVMSEMGGDLADHLCDQVEAPDLGLRCLCACRRR